MTVFGATGFLGRYIVSKLGKSLTKLIMEVKAHRYTVARKVPGCDSVLGEDDKAPSQGYWGLGKSRVYCMRTRRSIHG